MVSTETMFISSVSPKGRKIRRKHVGKKYKVVRIIKSNLLNFMAIHKLVNVNVKTIWANNKVQTPCCTQHWKLATVGFEYFHCNAVGCWSAGYCWYYWEVEWLQPVSCKQDFVVSLKTISTNKSLNCSQSLGSVQILCSVVLPCLLYYCLVYCITA